jgi:hypothetical protein
MDRKLLLLLLLCGVLAIAFWNSWAVYPLKLLVVVLHESGHALATWAVGGRVDGMAIDRFQGGRTMSRIPGGLLPGMVVASAGYVGSTVFGATILVAAARARSGKGVLTVLAVLLGIALVVWVRDPFTALFLACTILGLALLARVLPDPLSRAAAVFLGVFAAAYALWDIRDDLFGFHGGTDADILAHATGIPALVWAVLWAAIALLVIRTALARVSGGR